VIQDLWSLIDGTGAMNAEADAIYFTAGTAGYAKGVFGTIEAGPSVKTSKTKGKSTSGMPGMPKIPQMPQMPMM
jgi:hypothetical protein